MKLTNFRVYNYRSVNDSGNVEVGKTTTLVGRNESGKSNLLLALHSLNPAGGLVELSKIKNFPRHRRIGECTDDTQVVATIWELDGTEQEELAKTFPRARGVTKIEIGRLYKKQHTVSFLDIAPIKFSADEVKMRVRRLLPILQASADKLQDEPKKQAQAAIAKIEADLADRSSAAEWAKFAAPGLAAFRKAAASAGLVLGAQEDGILGEMEGLAASISNDPTQEAAARKWAIDRLPVFVYVEDYPELRGHQNIADYLGRKGQGQLNDADLSFEKVCKVADLDPQQLQTLLSKNDPETRNQLTNRASAVVTTELRRLWKDRPLKVRFNVDAQFLDTFVSDPNAVFDVEVNFDERSRGFKWFFSFYVTFAADTKGGPADNAILLLDEPGLYLHMTSQGDLLRHFKNDFKNQIIYTTHSPFMIPTDDLGSIRTVNIDQEAGTTVTNDPTGDYRTLFPLQAALGFSLAQSLFIGPNNLIVEGVTDYWIVTTISDYLRDKGGAALPKEITVTPAGGAQKITYMVSLLTSERLNVVVLLDEEGGARSAKAEMVRERLIRDGSVLFASDAFEPASKPTEADVEDILDPDVYEMLVRESYKAELKGKGLKINAKIPRIVKRYEEGFKSLGMEFHKTRPARLLLTLMANDPARIVTDLTAQRFGRLFGIVGERFRKLTERPAAPFR